MFFEKFLICAIHIINRISKSKFVYLFKPFIFFFKNLINIVVTTYLVYRFLFCFIKIFPISKRLIINKSTTTECFLNLYFLCFIWIKPIFEWFKHWFVTAFLHHCYITASLTHRLKPMGLRLVYFISSFNIAITSISNISTLFWYERWASNPHAFLQQFLRLPCLPIPALSHIGAPYRFCPDV